MFVEHWHKMQEYNIITLEFKTACNVVTNIDEISIPNLHVPQTYVNFIWHNIDIRKPYTIVFPDTITTVGLFFIEQFFKPALAINCKGVGNYHIKEYILKNLRVSSTKVGLEDSIKRHLITFFDMEGDS